MQRDRMIASTTSSTCKAGALLDHLVRPLQERRRDGEAESFGGLDVDNQFELLGLFHWKVSRLRAVQNLSYKDRASPKRFRNICTVGHQAPDFGKRPRECCR